MMELRKIYARVRLLNVAFFLTSLFCGIGFALPALAWHLRGWALTSVALIALAWVSFLVDRVLAGFGPGRLASTSRDMVEIILVSLAWLPLGFGGVVATLVLIYLPH